MANTRGPGNAARIFGKSVHTFFEAGPDVLASTLNRGWLSAVSPACIEQGEPNMKRILIILSIALLISCGGGGGGGDDEPDFAGVWDVSLTLTRDTCNMFPLPAQETDVVTINQADSDINVSFEDGSVSVGNVDSDHSFTVRQTMDLGSGCTGIETTIFSLLDDDQAEVSDIADVQCGETLCQIEYGPGTAVRR